MNHPTFKAGEPLIDGQAVTSGAYFDIVPAQYTGTGYVVKVLMPDLTWLFFNSYEMACFGCGWHRVNPTFRPDLVKTTNR